MMYSAEQGKWVERAARAGLTAKGVVYMIMGGLSAMGALGLGGSITGRSDAFQWIISLPMGRALLAIAAIGLVGHVIWRSIEAISDPEHLGNDLKGAIQRLGKAGSAIAYGAFAYYAGMLAVRGGQGGDEGEGSTRQFIVAKVLQQPGGNWIIGAVAIFFFGWGIHQLFRAISGRYWKNVKESSMTEVQRKTFKRIGVVGYLARGIVLGIIGGLFLKAASTVDASEAKGTEGAFQFLQNTPLGPWLLAIVAFGLAAFGGYCIMLARYRSIRRP